MQHRNALKDLNFDLLTPSTGSGGEGVCGQNICYHFAAFLILFNFDMQHDHVLKLLKF